MAAGNFVDMTMLGDKKLIKQLAKLPDRLQKKILRSAMRKAAKPVLASAKSKVPRVTGINTDPLRKGLKVKALKRSRNRIGVRIVTPERSVLGIPEGSKWYYPAHIELGTSKVAAVPYLRNAVAENKEQVFSIIRREVASGIVREAKRA